MLYENASSTERPNAVTVESLPDRTIVRLIDNIEESTVTEDDISYTKYTFDEVVFDLPDDRTETIESITEDFNNWWLYGSVEHEEPTLETRVQNLEELLFGLMEV